MSVEVLGVTIQPNLAKFTDPLMVRIRYKCLEALEEDLEWTITYVGSANNAEMDQNLDSILVGPVQPGVMEFELEVSPPDAAKIPVEDLLEVTALIISAKYRGKEFTRIGYYVYNGYSEEALQEAPPAIPDLEKLVRDIRVQEPLITLYNISWDEEVIDAAGGGASGSSYHASIANGSAPFGSTVAGDSSEGGGSRLSSFVEGMMKPPMGGNGLSVLL